MTLSPGDCLARLSTFHRNSLRHLSLDAWNLDSGHSAGYIPTPSIDQLSLVQSLPSLQTLTIHTDLRKMTKMRCHLDVGSLQGQYVDGLIAKMEPKNGRASLEAMVQGWWSAFDNFNIGGETFSCGGRVEIILVYRLCWFFASALERLSCRERLGRHWNNLKWCLPFSGTTYQDSYAVDLSSHVLVCLAPSK